MTASTQARVGYYGSYLYQHRNCWASSVGQLTKPYTFAHLSLAKDANGRRFIPDGTTLQSYGTGLCSPRTGTNNAIGVLIGDIDATDSDVEIAMAVGGVINETRCTDATTYGSVDDTYVVAALTDIKFVSVDL